LTTFTLKSLKEFGFGKKESMESIVKVELGEMIKRLEKASKTNDGMSHFLQGTQ